MSSISENDIDGKALAIMLKESDQTTLKELIPKVGPRIKIKNIFSSKFGGTSMTNNAIMKDSFIVTVNTSTQLKGQQKLNLTADGWVFGKFSEEVNISTVYLHCI